jgi:hypothetical protein
LFDLAESFENVDLDFASLGVAIKTTTGLAQDPVGKFKNNETRTNMFVFFFLFVVFCFFFLKKKEEKSS